MNSAVLAAKMKIVQSKTNASPAKKAFDFDSLASLVEDPSKAPWVLALATSLLLAPFLTRAFNIDEPLFLWAAAQIQSHPGDPYGFNVNWDNTAEPMWGVTKNPPGAAYYLAGAAALFGWRETGLHAAFLLPAAAAVLGLYFLAGRMCQRPVLAALTMLVAPVFLLSSATVMCDVMMLAFWLWSIYFWMKGLERNRHSWLVVAALLAAAAALTKYFGVSLIPLLAVYTVLDRRRLNTALIWLLLTVGLLVLYNVGTRHLYGTGLLADAGQYAESTRNLIRLRSSVTGKVLVGLAFAGGGVMAPLLLAPRLRPSYCACAIGAVFLAVGGMLAIWKVLPRYAALRPSIPPALFVLEWIIYAAAGLVVVWLMFTDLAKNRDAASVLLCLWVTGTLAFAGFINWSINGRSVLPLAPAGAILLARRMDELGPAGFSKPGAFTLAPLVGSALIALMVTQADTNQANSARRVAWEIAGAKTNEISKVWFCGHWGFQLYMQAAGGQPFDSERVHFDIGDLMAIPSNNCNRALPKEERYDTDRTLRIQANRWLTTQNPLMCAGFYSSEFGPLPFAWGSVPEEHYQVVRFKVRRVWQGP